MLRQIAVSAALLGTLAAESHDQQISRLLTASVKQELITTRRDLHMHPELSNREERTGNLIADRLRALGFDEVHTNVAVHGVVGLLKGSHAGTVVAWRADMDALPVTDAIDKPYRSTVAGVKHACGHDAHVAIALTLAKVLAGMRSEIHGTVKFLFQPAEEMAPPGEEGGAALMIKQGALENPRPSAIFALHVASYYPIGTVNYTPGAALASNDTFIARIQGKETHAAVPYRGIDPIVTASQCVLALQTIASRRVDPMQPVVITVGRIAGGNRANIIPAEVELEGTFRVLNEQNREFIRTTMRQVLQGCTASAGAQFTLTFGASGYPVTENNAELTQESLPLLRSLQFVKTVQRPALMASEDFSFYQKEIPGFFWFLGVGNDAKGIMAPHHTSTFDIDEDGLELGVRIAANQLLDYLERQGNQPITTK